MVDDPGGGQAGQSNNKKRAVILIHGMGNQSPMATLRGFVDEVWTRDPDLCDDGRDIWTKPDARLDSREVRRITTQQDKCDIRTDFFEFYWAHMMHSTRLSSVLWWLKHLFVGRFRRVPEGLRQRWFVGWLVIITLTLVLLSIVWSVLALINANQLAAWPVYIPLVPLLFLLIVTLFYRAFGASVLIVAAGAVMAGIGWWLLAPVDTWWSSSPWPAWVPVLGAPLIALMLTLLVVAVLVLPARTFLASFLLVVGAGIAGATVWVATRDHPTSLDDVTVCVSIVSAPVLAVLLWYLRHRVLVEVVGDAARYLTASPENIAARTRIREAGLNLLRALHDPEKGSDYDRIIVVGHSLGAVIGYDILSFYWADIAKTLEHEGSDAEALRAIEDAAAGVRHADGVPELSVEDYHLAQHKYADTLAVVSKRHWLVTDFVTLGSPLTHASYLMVDDSEEPLESEMERAKRGWVGQYLGLAKPEQEKTAFDRVATLFAVRANQREFPMCPPQTEKVFLDRCDDEAKKGGSFSYRLKPDGLCVPHHAALFAAVRWTNIFAPSRGALIGDPIGGSAARLFGPGIKDVPLKGNVSKRFFAHNAYWSQSSSDEEHIAELREAIDFLDGCKPTAPQSSAETE